MNDFARSVGAALSLIAKPTRARRHRRLIASVSLTASIVALLIGAPMGPGLRSPFPGAQVIIVLTNALLGLPPVVWVSRSTFCFRGPAPSARRDYCSRRPPW